ncbi:SDR family oxidoreductase [Streptomyces celluloflavus]|uniref:SDR family oxidoreductase n=1 Tax=Streptomyces celluloflavus TaxID=58344 RepID=UPI00346087A6|nr:SDR family oxidoreductase [Streptomyces celluloflavus]
MRLSGKTAVITGAARGLGRACAVRFAAEGADLLLMDIAQDVAGVPYPLGSRGQLAHTAALCEKAGGAVVAKVADVRDAADCQGVIDAALDRFGAVDVLVNNAGIAAPSGKVTHDITAAEWALMLDTDLSGAWRMMKAAAPAMVGQRAGSVINVSSTAGLVGYRHFAGYVTAKHGLIGLTKAAALDYAPLGVRVNALCPGSVRDDPVVEGRMLSEIARSLDVPVEEHEEIFVRDQPTNDLIEPADIAAAALWLASDDSRRVTGSVLTLDGGFTAR